MNRKLIAATFASAVIVTSGAAAAQAADSQYPPAAPTSSATKTAVAPKRAPKTETHAKNNDTQVLGTKKADATNTSTLPHTGAEWMATAGIGGGLLAGGTALVVAARRRQGA